MLDGIAGQRPSLQGRFNLSVPEIIDISSEDRNRSAPAPAATQPGAVRGTPAMFAVDTNTMQRVQLRECRSTTDVGCLEAIIGEEAAHAGATIYALHIEAGMMQNYSAQSRRVRDPSSPSRERWLASQVLEEFSGASGGVLLRSISDGGDLALDRVLRETSAYYLLGVDPTSTNRDGRAHKLRVKVTQPGASIRSRQWVVLNTAR